MEEFLIQHVEDLHKQYIAELKHVNRFNAKLANIIAAAVGSMWAFYVFNGLALTALPAAISSGNPTVMINWVSSNWIQLILLPAIMVSQNISGKKQELMLQQLTKLTGEIHKVVVATRNLNPKESQATNEHSG